MPDSSDRYRDWADHPAECAAVAAALSRATGEEWQAMITSADHVMLQRKHPSYYQRTFFRYGPLWLALVALVGPPGRAAVEEAGGEPAGEGRE